MANGLSGHVFRGGAVEQKQLVALLTHRFKAQAYAIVRRIDDAQFVDFGSDRAAQLVRDWTDGRAFDAFCEVRWTKRGAHYAVLLLTEESGAAEADASFGLAPADGALLAVSSPSPRDTHGLLLWGTRFKNGVWWEARIPRPLSYPFETTNDKPPVLSYYLYSDAAVVKWVRLRGLKEAERDAKV